MATDLDTLFAEVMADIAAAAPQALAVPVSLRPPGVEPDEDTEAWFWNSCDLVRLCADCGEEAGVGEWIIRWAYPSSTRIPVCFECGVKPQWGGRHEIAERRAAQEAARGKEPINA